MPAGIFISYRRADTRSEARAIYERLRSEFGTDTDDVFIDLEALEPGEDFVAALDRNLHRCRVLVAPIGAGWMGVVDAQGRRRLDYESDFVRIELAAALRRGIRVVPLLLEGTRMPPADQLPDDLKQLARLQAVQFRMDSFDSDIGVLVKFLRRFLNPPSPPYAVPAPLPAPPPPPSLPSPSPPPPLPAVAARPTWDTASETDEFGRWADLQVGKAVQRVRWIKPGEFMMGSPANEPERGGNEGPQHLVRITRGFWLADTACTQQLWLEVVGGKNPSRFTGDLNLPVENVSHVRVEDEFLKHLQAKLTGQPEVLLPTEAQWEYACRAKTTTPFSFGLAGVNYLGRSATTILAGGGGDVC